MSDTPQHIASELRRLSRKCGPDAGDIPATMVQAAAVIEQMSEGLAQMTRERDKARAEVTRLIAEVVNRNKRALDGDQAIHVANKLIDDNDALRAEVERLRAALGVYIGEGPEHTWKNGNCPDQASSWDSRDPECEACALLRAALQEPMP